ncbi:hypothetical protein HK405_015383, partial [Cladochytrium tenue]
MTPAIDAAAAAAIAATVPATLGGAEDTPPPATIPVVDFAAFRASDASADPVASAAVAKELVAAFSDIGFVMLRGHGLDTSLLQRVYNHAAKFFALPMSEKMKLEWESPEANRGYSELGREKVTQVMDVEGVKKLREFSPDIKESLEIGNEASKEFKNRWPDHDAEFRATMLEFFDTAHELHVDVMRALAAGLGLDEHTFDRFIDEKDNTLRLLHYPGVERAVLAKEDQMRAGPHTDYGTITLLFQDDAGGLEVQAKNGDWIPAVPVPGAVVVNAGDLLQRWSND